MANVIGLDLKVDEKYIADSVQDVVKAAIVQALGDPNAIIKNAVDNSINKYVTKNGEPANSDSWGAIPFLDWLATSVITETAREVVKEVVNENKAQFEEAIKKQLSTKKFRDDLAGRFLQTVLDSTEKDWRMPIEVKFECKKEDY